MVRPVLLLAVALMALSGCIVRAVPPGEFVAVGPAPCPGAVWVPAHYGEFGRWRPAHWRCGSGAVIVVR